MAGETVRFRFVSKTGETVVLEGSLRCRRENGTPVFAQGIFRDIPSQVQAEQRLQHDATHDKSTDLPNRSLFFDRLRQSIARTDCRREYLAVLFADLDEFEEVNDTYGHHIGDKLLVVFAKRLRKVLRKSDTAARLSGDEFAVMVESLASLGNTL